MTPPGGARRGRAEIQQIAHAGRAADRALEAVRRASAPGVRIGLLDAAAIRVLADHSAESAALGFDDGLGAGPFPASIAVSVNDELMGGHALDRVLCAGDLVTADLPVRRNGWHADASASWVVGGDRPDRVLLARAAGVVCAAGIRAARPGAHWIEVAHAMRASAERQGLVLRRGYSGHAIGRALHEPPSLAMHPDDARPDRGGTVRVEPGMVLAIEPIIGTTDSGYVRSGWVDRTADGSDAAYCEATIAVGAQRNLVLAGRSWCRELHDLWQGGA